MIQRHANRNPAILLGDVLMNGVVGKARERAKCAPKSASTSETPSDFAACCTTPNKLAAAFGQRLRKPFQPAYAAPTLMLWKRAGLAPWPVPITCSGCPFAAIRNAPKHPMIAIGDGRAGVPELGGDAAIRWILQHANALAVLDLPGDLAAELEVVALVVDGPTAIGLHVNGVAHAGKHFVERLLARLQADVGHADQRDARPTGGAHGAVRTRGADGGGGFARGHVSHELAVANDVGRLRGHAFVVERERAHAGAVLDARVANRVHQIRTVAQVIQLVEREKAHARVVGFRAEHAIELDGMADGFVNLKPELAAIEDQIEAAFGALIGRVQRHGFLGDARRVRQQIAARGSARSP
jgi:alpha-D-ribose 1-methylphosphonate 5-triphosphate synthase subunit PhnG